MSDWLWEVDENAVYTYAGPQIQELLGFLPREVEGRSIFDLVTPKQVGVLRAAFESRERVVRQELVHAHKDGRPVVLETNATPIFDEHGVFRGFRGIDRDITARKQAEILQREIQTVSHDLRGPLPVIGGHAFLLEEMLAEAKLGSVGRTSIEAIKRSVDRLSAMIEELANSASLDAGHSDLRVQPMVFASFIEDFLCQRTPLRGAARVHAELEPSLPLIEADDVALHRILLNLVGNAFKYSPDGTPVTISALLEDGMVRISVRDEGPGISLEDESSVFDRFFRSKKVKRDDGLGLGLYIARMLVEAHGGRIWFENHPGKGCSFHFTVPIARSTT